MLVLVVLVVLTANGGRRLLVLNALVWPLQNGVRVLPPCLCKEVGVLLWVIIQDYGHDELTERELASMYEVRNEDE